MVKIPMVTYTILPLLSSQKLPPYRRVMHSGIQLQLQQQSQEQQPHSQASTTRAERTMGSATCTLHRGAFTTEVPKAPGSGAGRRGRTCEK